MPSTHPNEDTTTEAVKAVKRGDIDLAALTDAMRQIVKAGKAAVAWRLDLDALDVGLSGEVGPSDLTLAEQLDVLDRSGLPWHMFDPAENQRNAHALLVVLLMSRTGANETAAIKAAGTITTGTWDDAYRLVEERPADPT